MNPKKVQSSKNANPLKKKEEIPQNKQKSLLKSKKETLDENDIDRLQKLKNENKYYSNSQITPSPKLIKIIKK